MNNIILFESKKVRRIWSESDQKWYFSIDDVVEALTDTVNVKDYIKKLRKRDGELDSYWGTNCPLVEMIAADGKKRKIKSADAEGLLRIIQSIPSPKAEPFKRWLAKVGYERLEEIENPELAAKRMREIYQQKGYSDDWIEKRMRGIAVRDELTEEWKKRGVREQIEYAILTSEISKATFGMTPAEYKKFKELDKPNENLRDQRPAQAATTDGAPACGIGDVPVPIGDPDDDEGYAGDDDEDEEEDDEEEEPLRLLRR